MIQGVNIRVADPIGWLGSDPPEKTGFGSDQIRETERNPELAGSANEYLSLVLPD